MREAGVKLIKGKVGCQTASEFVRICTLRCCGSRKAMENNFF